MGRSHAEDLDYPPIPLPRNLLDSVKDHVSEADSGSGVTSFHLCLTSLTVGSEMPTTMPHQCVLWRVGQHSHLHLL